MMAYSYIYVTFEPLQATAICYDDAMLWKYSTLLAPRLDNPTVNVGFLSEKMNNADVWFFFFFFWGGGGGG